LTTINDEMTSRNLELSRFELRHIVEMFAQGDSSLERTQSGLGIGLSLTQSLVSLHGGNTEVQSPGRGK